MIFAVLLLLTGCVSPDKDLERGMELRSRLLEAQQCSFDVKITADYGDKLCVFSVACRGNGDGSLDFTLKEPESISGITGKLSEGDGKLTFGDVALQFDPLAEGLVSPVSASWIFFNTLRSGYLTAAGMEDALLRLTINDSYADDALQLDIWLDGENRPVRAEILHKNRRIISMDVTNFDFQ